MSNGELASLLVYAGLATLAAISDLRSRTIPNYLNAVIAFAGLASVFAIGGSSDALSALAHLAVALAVGLGVYALGMWGGGDAKFYAATSAWFKLHYLPSLVVGISLAGLLLLIVWFVGGRLGGKTTQRSKAELPYGIAIAVGGIVSMGAVVVR